MDALVKAALDKVNQAVKNIPWDLGHTQDKEDATAKVIYAVDALKSALKAIDWDRR